MFRPYILRKKVLVGLAIFNIMLVYTAFFSNKVIYTDDYEEKIKLIEKAEELDKIKNVMLASRDLNILHRLWKNELGPVSKEYREELWGRFQRASNKIHAKRQEHQKEINSIQNENLLKKEKVLSKMREVLENVPDSHNEWQNTIQIFNNLKDEFQKIRNIPRKKNKICWAI